jgi:hypothetical protein
MGSLAPQGVSRSLSGLRFHFRHPTPVIRIAPNIASELTKCNHLQLTFIKKNAADGYFMNFFPKSVGE